MKILALRGKNIASLEGDFEIDFTAEPLLSAGIFAITGNTGSGKSTLLDVLCLALYDNTPRMSRATENNVTILDVGDKMIHQKDCRTLLRRGTGEGYAEVDFISVANEKYRATWMVKRARGRIAGSLQNSEMRLLNLSSGKEAQGRKTELLAQIVELTGLSFEQFTRTVLLPQGDFAAFLKAKQSEKAELLEKLTGTGIYSRISILIYEKTKRAEQEHAAVLERIKDIDLPDEEQLKAFAEERKALEQQSASLKTELDRLSVKIKRIGEREALLLNRDKAAETLEGVRKRMAEARPRYEYIARMDSVQDIRDVFNELQLSEKHCKEDAALLERRTGECEENTKALALAGEALRLLIEAQDELDGRIAGAEPEIIRARELDILIAGAVSNEKDAADMYETALAAKGRIEKSIQSLAGEIRSAEENRDRLAAWFAEHDDYKDIVRQPGLVLALLDDAGTAVKQSGINAGRLSENDRLLESETQKLIALRTEAERLDKLLPAKIAKLRAGLQDGMPCPVCGSVHHPAHSAKAGSMEEAELNKAKLAVDNEISMLTDTVEQRKSEITRLKALAENYSLQAAETMAKAEGFLNRLTSWRADFERGILQSAIRETSRQWAVYSDDIIRAAETLNNKQAHLNSERDNLAEATLTLTEKARKKDEAASLLKELSERRSTLLNGKTVDELTAYFASEKKKITLEVKLAGEERGKLASRQELLKGMVSQISLQADKQGLQCAAMRKIVDEWLSVKQGSLTEEALSELLTKDNQWVQAERRLLGEMKEQEAAALTTLAERNRSLDAHDSVGPNTEGEGETKELLIEKHSGAVRESDLVIRRIAGIDASLDASNKARERIKVFEKDLEAKAVTAENWKKLNELFGSANGSKFKEIAQGYTLDALLTYANVHLRNLSHRYLLQRIPDTLALQVADLDMLGDIRTVHSLSGGESFLVSLALALGLASLMSNRMNIESMFIDEGFGSLDTDTLLIAMDALERLQLQGHKIGVISHVPEMTERIAARVRVVKTSGGRSSIKIEGTA
jgi:exonuclease SbcC